MKRSIRFYVVLVLAMLMVLSPVAHAQEGEADLDGIKTYLIDKVTELQESAEALHEASHAYFDLAEASDFDYAALWEADAEAAATAVNDAKAAWIAASPLYEQVEGIVAGVPSLSEFDVILDAGTSAEEGPEGAVPFDLTLADGRVLPQPGNIFGLLEATLWGTRPEFSSGVEADLDANEAIDFGELLPEANMLQATADALDDYTSQLLEAAEAWEPTETDAFTALVVMTPTMSEYFESWKNSRFVSGEDSTQSDFVVISRLSDVVDILSSLEVVYTGISPLVAGVDAEQHEQINQAYVDLQGYVTDLLQQEQDGKQFTPEEADFFGTEAQDRAQAITGQVAQVAALLDITLPE